MLLFTLLSSSVLHKAIVGAIGALVCYLTYMAFTFLISLLVRKTNNSDADDNNNENAHTAIEGELESVDTVESPNHCVVYCRYCGKQIDGDVIFCPYCGKKQGVSISEKNERPIFNLNIGSIISNFINRFVKVYSYVKQIN